MTEEGRGEKKGRRREGNGEIAPWLLGIDIMTPVFYRCWNQCRIKTLEALHGALRTMRPPVGRGLGVGVPLPRDGGPGISRSPRENFEI